MRYWFNRAFGNVASDNSWYLCVEVFWASIYSSGLTFAGPYAIRLGASNSGVSLLSSVPALTAALIMLPAGHFLQTRLRPSNWILSSLLLARAGTLLYVIVPWMHPGGLSQGALFVGFFALLTPPNHFFNLGFIPFLAKALPENRRADTFAARNVLTGAVNAISVFLMGLWLAWAPFPANYQVMFFVGFVFSLISLFYLNKVNVPDSAAAQSAAVATSARARLPDWRTSLKEWRGFLRASWKIRPFAQITFNTFVYAVGIWAATPLLLLYFVRTLGATESWLGLLGSVTNLSAIFGYLFWQRIIRRWGEGKTLRWTIVLVGLYPLLAGAIPSLAAILLVAGLNGIITAGVNLTHLNTFLKTFPEREGHNYTALHLTVMNLGAFICPLIGIVLANRFGFATVLIGCGVLSILGATSFWIWPVGEWRQPRPGASPRPQEVH